MERPDEDYTANQKQTTGHTFDEIVKKFNARHEDKQGDMEAGIITAVDVENRTADCEVGEQRFADCPWVLPVFSSRNGNGMDYIPEVGQRVALFHIDNHALILGAIPQETDAQQNEPQINFKKNREAKMNTDDFRYQMNEDLGSRLWLKAKGVLEFFAEARTFLNVNGLKHLIEANADNFVMENNGSGNWVWKTDIARRAEDELDGNSFIKMSMKGNVDEDTPLLFYRVGKEDDDQDSKVRVEINSTAINGENPLEVFVEGDVSLKCDSNVSLTTTGKKKPGHIDVIAKQGNINIEAEAKNVNVTSGGSTNVEAGGPVNIESSSRCNIQAPTVHIN